MPYTLTSAATLGYDLVRLPGGRQVAGVLVSALRSGPAEWALLAAHHPLRTSDPAADPFLAAEDSARARELAETAPRLSQTTGAPAAADGPGAAGGGAPTSVAALAEQLRTSMVGSASALERLVRHEALDAGATEPSALPDLDDPARVDRALAADVLADAAVAAYAARQLPRALRRRLAEPYERAVAGSVPGTFDLAPDPRTPWGTPLRSLLAALRDLDAPGRERWRRAVDATRADRRPWAATMHDACWAAHASGRVPAAAAAQLLAVQAFADAGFDAGDGATGVWNAVSGCVQGLVVADLLGEDALAVLTEPWALATGEGLLAS
ncbi:hypothetical protein [Quadrisphaera sp. INWT6]|uniref:hypothetical protein n=1 Tax=Quadrisphaera sp. INWT6 TaxID=2596917 RepID=UPI0018920253|nr:hypothetical protein [Quadrisphaera sp. INWT6]MBF5083155.1 hypothetical protein [Quadrisphaera sp. INWT6]